MKALQLRKKNLAQVNRPSGVPPISDSTTNTLKKPEQEDVPDSHGDMVSLVEISNPDSQPDLVHVNIGAERKQGSAERLVSPASLPEVSEAPSTQGSSFTDEHYLPTQDSAALDGRISENPEIQISEKDEDKRATLTALPLPGIEKKVCVEFHSPATAERITAAPTTSDVRYNGSSVPSTKLADHLDPDLNDQELEEEKTPQNENELDSKSADTIANVDRTMPFQTPASPPNGAAHVSSDIDRETDHADIIEPRPTTSNTSGSNAPGLGKRRREILWPIHVSSSPDVSDISDDDSLVEELRYAKLEEAKPISVNRSHSPITPIFAKGSSDRLRDMSRAASTPVTKQSDSAVTTLDRTKSRSGRSVSTALPQWPPPTGDVGQMSLTKKGTVSSGISTRIKALELFSRRDSTAATPPQSPQQATFHKPSSPFDAFKKRASIIQAESPASMTTAQPLPKQIPSPSSTPASTAEKTVDIVPRPWVQRNGSSIQINAPTQKGESISITARIVRDPKPIMSQAIEDSLEPSVTNLHRSPLIVEHETLQQPDSEPTTPKTGKPRFSQSSDHSLPRLPTSGSMASRISETSGQRQKQSGNLPRSTSDKSLVGEEKSKESRKDRPSLMKRMSNLAAGPRRNLMAAFSPSVKEEVHPNQNTERKHSDARTESSLGDSPAHVVDIGDVNVQFPDTLLWRRRFMRINDQGYLILTPPIRETIDKTKGISRRFHLSEFKKPTLPDPEREELPYSILMDLEDGTSLQCACESRYTQTQVLRSKSNALLQM